MLKEFGETKHKVTEMEHVVRTNERNLAVSLQDQSQLSASLAANVGKLDKLLQHAKSMRQHRADQQVEINAGRRRQGLRLKVNTPFAVLPACFLGQGATRRSASMQSRKAGIK